MPACPPADHLRALLSGDLPDPDVAELDGHLRGCEPCRRQLDTLSDSPVLTAWLGPRATDPREFPFLEPSDRPGCVGRVGRFHVEREVGRGGMGAVFRAWDDALGRPVALKVLRAGRDDPGGRARFAREARAAAQVIHDHLVPVLGVEEAADGRTVLVMPFVAGPSLRERLRAGPEFTPREAADVVRQVAAGLAAAHAAGLVHRDVKPANVLLDEADGRAKLTDFGLARPVEPGDTLTQDGAVAGTPEYLAPEQADARRVLPAADVYALGVTLYECLTGVVPFRGPLLDVLARHRSEEPVPPRRLTAGVPADLETITLKCLEKDPARRYPTAAGLEEDLSRFLAGRPVVARPLGLAGRGWRWARRNPLPVAVVVVALLGAAAAGTGWWRAGVKADEAERNAGAAAARATEAEQARGEARRHAELAEERAKLALGAINTLIRKAQSVTDAAPGTVRLKKELSEAALADLRKLAANAAAVPGADRATVLAHRRLGDAFDLLGQTDDALREWGRACRLAERIVQADPADVLARRDLAGAHYSLGFTRTRLRETAAARTHLSAAVDTLEVVCRDHPDDAAALQNLGVALNGRSDLARDTGDRAAARADAERAVGIAERLLALHPDKAMYRNDVIYSHGRLGYVCLWTEHDYPAGAGHARAALAAVSDGLARTPDDLTLRRFRRVCLLDLCSALVRLDDLPGAEAAAAEAVPLVEAAAAAEPENALVQEELGKGLWHLSWVRVGQGRLADAESLLVRAGGVFEAVAEKAKSPALVAADIPTNWYYLGLIDLFRGKHAGASDRLDRAAREARRLLPAAGAMAAELNDLADVARRLPAALADPAPVRDTRDPPARRLAAWRAAALGWRGELPAARAAIDALRTAHPDDPEVLYVAAVVAGRSARESTDPADRERFTRAGLDALADCGRAKPGLLSALYLVPDTAPLRAHPTFPARMREALR